MSHDRRFEDSEGVVSAPRYLVMTGLFLALYGAAEVVVPTFTARPGLMFATVLSAPVLGVLVAAWQKQSRQRRGSERMPPAMPGSAIASQPPRADHSAIRLRA